jgi:protein SCO1/2
VKIRLISTIYQRVYLKAKVIMSRLGYFQRCFGSSHHFATIMPWICILFFPVAFGVWLSNRNETVVSGSPISEAVDLPTSESTANLVKVSKSEVPVSENRFKRSNQISNVELVTHEGKSILFRDDLVTGKKVVINFMYTICNGICPTMTRNISEVRDELAAKGVDDITFISISIEPDSDTPEQLSSYMARNGIENKPGVAPWIFLTGNLEDIDSLRRSLGVYDPDPVVDADRRQHGGTLTYGNDRSNWWGATPALQLPELTVQTLVRHLSSDSRRLPELPTQ